jgi:hypothetical protein
MHACMHLSSGLKKETVVSIGPIMNLMVGGGEAPTII